MFERRHYETIAKCLGEAFDQSCTVNANQDGDSAVAGVNFAIHEIVAAFERDNPRFNKERFIKAVHAYSRK